ncbi:MAG: Lrp/AsnC family transcriptional regulator [Candidatus Thorarchaeota archaeon]|nr:MAG: Lrp/AsnC family transcriptional regulator [Candidatus Thorarchaeota archaeon]
MKKLVKLDVIRSYTAILDPLQVYAERNTILLVKTNPRELGLSEALIDMPELHSLDGISGEYSLLGLFRFRSPMAFERFLDNVDRVVAKSGAQTYNLVQVLTTYKTNGFIVRKSSNSSPSLTEKDWNLLNVLRRRTPSEEKPFAPSQEDIGKAMKPQISQPAVSKAMTRLESRGAIAGYSLDIDYGCVGLPIKFFLQIRPRPGSIANAAKKISQMEQVWDLHRVSDDYGLFANVRVESVSSYNDFIRKLYENEAVLDTQSQVSLEEWFIPS